MSLSLFTENCYVMDTGFFHNVQHYYPETFPSFWRKWMRPSLRMKYLP